MRKLERSKVFIFKFLTWGLMPTPITFVLGVERCFSYYCREGPGYSVLLRFYSLRKVRGSGGPAVQPGVNQTVSAPQNSSGSISCSNKLAVQSSTEQTFPEGMESFVWLFVIQLHSLISLQISPRCPSGLDLKYISAQALLKSFSITK